MRTLDCAIGAFQLKRTSEMNLCKQLYLNLIAKNEHQSYQQLVNVYIVDSEMKVFIICNSRTQKYYNYFNQLIQ